MRLIAGVFLLGLVLQGCAARHPAKLRLAEGVWTGQEEGRTLDNYGVLYSAINLYHADMDGAWPADLNAKTFAGKYIDFIPSDGFTGSNAVKAQFDGQGGWVYDPATGNLCINLPGTDKSGKPFREHCSQPNLKP
jgi:hypothetical protein